MSVRFEWSDEFAIDRGTIDREHRKLFELANRVFLCFEVEASRGDLQATVDELFRYMGYHFDHEETMMREVGFPGYSRHVELHHAIVENVREIVKGAGSIEDLASVLRYVMVHWVSRHILVDDRQAAEYVRGKNDDKLPVAIADCCRTE
jgi:hemerythrin